MMEWISVEERLPGARQEVLFVARFNDVRLVCFGYKDSDDADDAKWIDPASTNNYGEPSEVYGVSHWMPLPDPPKS